MLSSFVNKKVILSIALVGGLIGCGQERPLGIANNTVPQKLGFFQQSQSCEEIETYYKDYQSRAIQYPKSIVTDNTTIASTGLPSTDAMNAGSTGPAGRTGTTGTTGTTGSTGTTSGTAAPTGSGTSAEAPQASPNPASPSTDSKSNQVVQSDVAAKDDRGFFYHIKNQELKITKIIPVAEVKPASTLALGFDASELVPLQVQDKTYLAIFGTKYNYIPYGNDVISGTTGSLPTPLLRKNMTPAYYDLNPTSFVAILDVTNPNDPKEVKRIQASGSFLEAHAIPGSSTVVWIENRSLYTYYSGGTNPTPLIPNKTIKTAAGEQATPMVGCNAVYLYQNDTLSTSYVPSNLTMTSISTVDLTQADLPIATQSVLSSGWRNVISVPNPHTLLLAQMVDTSNRQNTELFAFNLDPKGIQFKAKGSVEGNVLNRFSLDATVEANKNVVRVFHSKNANWWGNCGDCFVVLPAPESTTTSGTTGSSLALTDQLPAAELAPGNYLTLLEMNADGSMQKLARSDNFAADERIQSSRFVGNLGYVVTFRQIDPLFIFDLKNNQITRMGELKIPGFSTHLVMIQDGLLLGVGRGESSQSIEAKLFDVSDPKNPKVVSSQVLSQNAYSGILGEYRFLGSDTLNNFALPIDEYQQDGSYDSRSFIVLFHVNPESKAIEQVRRVGGQLAYSTYSPGSYLRGTLFEEGALVGLTINHEIEVYQTQDLKKVFDTFVLPPALKLWKMEDSNAFLIQLGDVYPPETSCYLSADKSGSPGDYAFSQLNKTVCKSGNSKVLTDLQVQEFVALLNQVYLTPQVDPCSPYPSWQNILIAGTVTQNYYSFGSSTNCGNAVGFQNAQLIQNKIDSFFN